MSIDLKELATVVMGLVSAVQAIIELGDSIRRKLIISSNDVARLTDELSKLSGRLQKIGTVADVLGHYIVGYTGSIALYEACGKLLQVLVARRGILASKKGGQQCDWNWASIGDLFANVGKARQDHIKVILDRVKFLDTEDAKDIKNHIEEFDNTYTRADVYLSSRKVDDLTKCVRSLHERAQKLVAIFDKLLASLARIAE